MKGDFDFKSKKEYFPLFIETFTYFKLAQLGQQGIISWPYRANQIFIAGPIGTAKAYC